MSFTEAVQHQTRVDGVGIEGVGPVERLAEVLEGEPIRQVDVGVTVRLVGVPVVGASTVEVVWVAVGRSRDRIVGVRQRRQAEVEGLVSVVRSVREDAVIRGERIRPIDVTGRVFLIVEPTVRAQS